MLAARPLSPTLWLVTLLAPVAVLPYETVVPYSTTEVESSSVVHVIVAVVVVILPAAMFEITGGVVSGGPPASSRLYVFGKPAAATSFGPWVTAPSAETEGDPDPSKHNLRFSF